ncbi:MAG: OB-fold domain-containing protein [Pseudomonadales bacterium]|nr:OB-fold domain-containing protein [Pseudomonadales bacterium]
MSEYYLNPGLAIPRAQADGLDKAYWDGLAEDKLIIQRCLSCKGWQWGPEWLCHRCHSFDLGYEEIESTGVIYSHERVWHPIHPALKDQGPYVVVLVEFPQADYVRVVGNLLGDPLQPLEIGAKVKGVFEHHTDTDPVYTLLQWQLA